MVSQGSPKVGGHSRIFRIAPFVVALMCFFLPFVDISCAGQKVVSLNGAQLVFGTEIRTPTRNIMPGSPTSPRDEVRPIPPMELAIGAAICIGFGIGVSILSGRVGSISAIIAAATSIVFLWLIRRKFSVEAQDIYNQTGIPVVIESGIGFIACLISLVGAIAVSVQQLCAGSPRSPNSGSGAWQVPPPPAQATNWVPPAPPPVAPTWTPPPPPPPQPVSIDNRPPA